MDSDAKQRLTAIMTQQGFNRSLAGLELLEAGGGRAKARIEVVESVQNLGGTLHGGAIATIVDNVGTIAIVTADRNGRPGVTTDLNVSYLAPGPGGRGVIADAQALKVGRTLAFVLVDLRREDDGVLIAQGRMTKHLGT